MTDGYDSKEQTQLILEFTEMLWGVTRDGGRKRRNGLKVPWYQDKSHEVAIYSHLAKWKAGQWVDEDSGQHPLVHLAWRALAIAWQQTHGQVDPEDLLASEEEVVGEPSEEASE